MQGSTRQAGSVAAVWTIKIQTFFLGELIVELGGTSPSLKTEDVNL